jgi:multidrug efflux pump subunit AcrA (membrane-fusion protein)
MFANVRITTDMHPGVVSIPKRAILYEGETPYVFVLRDTVELPEGSGDAARGPTEGFRVQRVVIETGYDDATMVEVLTGIAEGDRVIVAGQNGLDPDSVVTVNDASELPGSGTTPDASAPSAETGPSPTQAAEASGAAPSEEGSSP